MPQITFTLNELTLSAQAVVPSGATALWAFGDDAGFIEGASQEHTFARPGVHEVRLRVVRDEQLFEYRARVVVSRDHEVTPPLTAFPDLSVDANAADVPEGHTHVIATTEGADGASLTTVWQRLGDRTVRGSSLPLDLEPGTHTLAFTAVRDLNVRLHSHQRFDADQPFVMEGLSLRTNRTFDETGETTTDPNLLTSHLFSAGPISPADRWTLELPLADNPALRSVTQTDKEQLDLSEIDDAVLVMEYETVGS